MSTLHLETVAELEKSVLGGEFASKMIHPRLDAVLEECPVSDLADLKAHLLRVRHPAKYLMHFSASDVLEHLAMIQRLHRTKPIVVHVHEQAANARIVVVGLDRRGVCSVVTAAIARRGFDIREMDVVTYRRSESRFPCLSLTRTHRAAADAKYIIDLQVVAAGAQRVGVSTLQAKLQDEWEEEYRNLESGKPLLPGRRRRTWFLALVASLVFLAVAIAACPTLFPPASDLLLHRLVSWMSFAAALISCVFCVFIPLVDRHLKRTLAKEVKVVRSTFTHLLQDARLGSKTRAEVSRLFPAVPTTVLTRDPEAHNRSCMELAEMFDAADAAEMLLTRAPVPATVAARPAYDKLDLGPLPLPRSGKDALPQEEGTMTPTLRKDADALVQEICRLESECSRLQRTQAELETEKERYRLLAESLQAERDSYRRSLQDLLTPELTDGEREQFAGEAKELHERLSAGGCPNGTIDELIASLEEKVR